MNNLVYLLLGGNQGDVRSIFATAREQFVLQLGREVSASALYQTEPWGFTADKPFLNQVVLLETLIAPGPLLEKVLQIEKDLGRLRVEGVQGYVSRPVDIDILFYNDDVISSKELTVPHPRLHQRNFTLFPLNDIAPELLHPVLHKTISELKLTCEDTLKVELLPE